MDYLECSYKDKFSSREPRLSVHHAKVVALATAAKFYLMRAADSKTTTLDCLKRKMSTAWDRVKTTNQFSYTWKDLVSVQNQLDKVGQLVTPKDTVVAVNFPVLFSPFLKETVEGSVDAIILKNEDSPSKRYLQVLLFDYSAFAGRSASSSLLKFLAGLYDLSLRDASISRFPRRYSFLKLHNSSVHTVTVQPYKDDKIYSVLSTILKGMNEEVRLPTTDERVCKDCLHNSLCDWIQE